MRYVWEFVFCFFILIRFLCGILYMLGLNYNPRKDHEIRTNHLLQCCNTLFKFITHNLYEMNYSCFSCYNMWYDHRTVFCCNHFLTYPVENLNYCLRS